MGGGGRGGGPSGLGLIVCGGGEGGPGPFGLAIRYDGGGGGPPRPLPCEDTGGVSRGSPGRLLCACRRGKLTLERLGVGLGGVGGMS